MVSLSELAPLTVWLTPILALIGDKKTGRLYLIWLILFQIMRKVGCFSDTANPVAVGLRLEPEVGSCF